MAETAGLQTYETLIIELVTGIVLLFSSFSAEQEQLPREEEHKEFVIGIIGDKALDPSANERSVEDHVREAFADEPMLIRIAWCETKFEHFDEFGRVVRGELTPKDLGVMQINEYYHGKTVKALGYNIHTLEGNLSYARWLYEREGLAPWASSKHCWGNPEIAVR